MLGFNFGKSKSSSNNQSSSFSNQNVWGPQAGYLQDLYSGGSSLLGSQGNVGAAAQDLAGQIMPGTFPALGALGNIAQGGGPLSQFTNPINPFTQAQVGNLGSNLMDMFKTDIAPMMGSAANMAGGLGQARHQLGLGQAAGDMFQAFTTGATDLMGGAYGQAANAANAQTQAMLGASAAMPDVGAGLFNLGMSPFSAAWAPLQSFASLLGGPAVLGQSGSQSTGTSSANQWNLGIGGGKS